MFPTAEQADGIRQLRSEYGEPTRTMYEHTQEPYGIIWLIWPGPSSKNNRNLFINPDGSRLSWSLKVHGV